VIPICPIIPTLHRSPFRGLACCAAMLLFCPGCEHDSRPELAPVHGRVTLDGKPLVGEVVSFRPLDGGRQSSGKTDQQGNYTLIYLRDIAGAKVGRHRVTVGASDLVAPHAKRVPDRYNLKTTLQAEVRSGENEIDFPLTSS
jgi:hypothetical protein